MKTIRKLQISCVISLLLVAMMSVLLTPHFAHASTLASNWSGWGYNAANTRYNPHETILNNGNVGNLVQHWAFTNLNQSQFASEPAVVNSVVYAWSLAGSGGGILYAFNAKTGTLNWSYTSAWFAASPAIANGTLYCYFNNNINALNATTGALLWGVPAVWDLDSSPSVANGVVYFVNNTGSIEAADASSGASLWMSQALNSVDTGLTIASGQLFAGDADGNLYAFHLPT